MARPSVFRLLIRAGLGLMSTGALAVVMVALAPAALASGSGNYAFEYYAGAYQSYAGVGVSADMTQHVPALSEPGDGTAWYDSSALIRAVSADYTAVVEVGWLVSSTINGDGGANAHLFVRKIDHGTGCFNIGSCGFVPYSSTHTVGMILTPTTTPQNYVIEHYYGNWWIGYQGDWVGYYPDSAWSTPFTTMGSAGWYGRVGSTNNHPCADMGNGIYGSTRTGSPAIIKNMALITTSYTYLTASATAFMTYAPWYNIGPFSGSSLKFGGPGAC